MALVDELGAVVELGCVVDLELAGHRLEFGPDVLTVGRPRGPLMLWSANLQALAWFEGVRTPRARGVTGDPGEAGDIFRQWTRGREPTKQRTLEVDITGPMERLGACVAIRYLSDKFNARGAWVLYKHFFERGVRASVQGDKAKMYCVRGGRLRITEDGIEG